MEHVCFHLLVVIQGTALAHVQVSLDPGYTSFLLRDQRQMMVRVGVD